MAAPAGLTAVIVTYNSSQVLGALLDSLGGAAGSRVRLEVVVVDNHSADGSVAIAEAHPLAPTVIQSGRNAGYSAAINTALDRIPAGNAVLILNPDLRLHPGAVGAMMDRLTGNTGIVVPRLVRPDGRLHHSIRREPSLLTAWSEALLGGDLAARLGLGEIVAQSQCYNRFGPVTCASGAALLVSPEARERIGSWSEAFFLYSEEIDYMRRARDLGFDIVYEPAAVASHVGGESNSNPDLFALLTANRIRYYRHYHGAASAALFQLGVIAGLVLRLGQGAIHRSALRAAMTASQGRFAVRTR